MWKEDVEKLIDMVKPLVKIGPVHPVLVTELGAIVPGISKRELFAGMAMQGLLSCSQDGDIVKASVRFADALLGELNKDKELTDPPFGCAPDEA